MCIYTAFGASCSYTARVEPKFSKALQQQLPPERQLPGSELAYQVVKYNNHPDTTKGDVLALIDRAILATA